MDPTLAELLDKIGNAADTEALAAILADLSADELEAVRAELSDTIRLLATSVKDGSSVNPTEDMETVRAAQESLQAVTARTAELADTAQATADEADAILATLDETQSDDDSDEAETEVVEDGDEEASVQTETVETETEPVAVAASAAPRRRAPLGAVAANRPRQPEPEATSSFSLQASAGVADAGIRAGHRFANPKELGHAMAEAFRGLTPGAKLMVAQADFSDQVPYRFTDDAETNFVTLSNIRREAERGEAIVASGGFCAPGTPIYDFFSVSFRSGLLELPTVVSERGNLQYPVSPGVADLLAETGIAFPWTNTIDEDPGELTKPVFTPACVETRSCDIVAYPTRLQFGNFQQIFYPEFVGHMTGEALITHDHKVDIELIDDIIGFATLTQDHAGNVGGGTLVNLSHTLGFIAAWYRNKWRMGTEAPLDVLLPAYVRDAAAADYVARNGTVSMDRAYAAADDYFRVANLRVQWLANLSSDFSASASFPAADAIVYAPGTVIRQTRASLNLGVVRDSTLNDTNDFQTFEETFDSACLVGNEVVHLANIDVCPTGATGAQEEITCWTGESS